MIKSEQQVCPYTGLRSFSEEESLYFKGRDHQVRQITSLLERNKFLMVTGASGEGKSSVVYAGLIPNARAGFFKARYTNWIVADFRPERDPLGNLSKTIAKHFDSNPHIVGTELKRGFSSLVDLYLNSGFYIDESDQKWADMGASEQKKKKRNAANFLILIDQFEEFFTNPENFNDGILSADSQVVVNLILETARIAIKQDLPVYVVCTMRSDYIGQCSAFRGLAEYIGFSQFFVPRLKRKDLKQVIEEPALLSGSSISQRLVERLLFDLADGIDQLPILQHALNRIWLAADNGREQMNLIHYAMTGGISRDELPEEDIGKFDSWFSQQPPYKQELYAHTGLERVIEIHADLLYEGAYDYHKRSYPQSQVTPADVRSIIEVSFSCLTRIDNSRAVRNRITLQEITGIIDRPDLSSEVIAGVLDIFREDVNSFIRPIKAGSYERLAASTVLDVTHESLIRSWDRLNRWAEREYRHYTTYLDFKKQLDRWKASGKNSDYLLPVGPLSFFENWYSKCNPNPAWLRRYSGEAGGQEKPDVILADTRSFLKKSARKVMVTRAFMKYGSQRIAVVCTIVVMLVLSGFYGYDARQKTRESVVQKVKADAISTLDSEFVDYFAKALYLVSLERQESGGLLRYIDGVADDEKRVALGIDTYLMLMHAGHHFNLPVKDGLITRIDADMDKLEQAANNPATILGLRVSFVHVLAFDNYYNPGSFLKEKLTAQSSALYRSIVTLYSNTGLHKPSVSLKINEAIQLWLTFARPGKEELTHVLDLISPFENDRSISTFQVYYPAGVLDQAINHEALDFNGGYQAVASLYAAAGGIDKFIRCLEVLSRRNDFFSERAFNNFTNVIAYLYQYGHRSSVPIAVKWIVSHSSRSEESVFDEMLNRSGYIFSQYFINFKTFVGYDMGKVSPSLCMADRTVFYAIAEDYEQAVRRIKDNDSRNYLMASHHKRVGLFDSKYSSDRVTPADDVRIQARFDEAVKFFRAVSNDYLDKKITIIYPYLVDGMRSLEFSRRDFFLRPDYINGWLVAPFHSTAYFNYLYKKGLLNNLSESGSNAVYSWIAANPGRGILWGFQLLENNANIPDSTLIRVLDLTPEHSQESRLDKNGLWLILANRSFARGDTLEAMKWYRQIDMQSRARWTSRYNEAYYSFLLNQLRFLSGHLAASGDFAAAQGICESFGEEYERILAYAHAARKSYEGGQYAASFVLLDSAYTRKDRLPVGKDRGARPIEYAILRTLSEIGGEEMETIANNFLRDMGTIFQTFGRQYTIDGYTLSGEYYKALSTIPANTADEDRLSFYFTILWRTGTDNPSANAFPDVSLHFDKDYYWHGARSLN